MRKKYSATQVLFRLGRYVLRYRGYFLIAISAMLLYSALTASFPAVMKVIIDEGAKESKIELSSYLLSAVVIMILFSLRGFAYYWQNFTMLVLGQRLNRDLRSQMLSKLLYLPFRFFNTRKPGELISRFTVDIGVIEQAFVLAVTGPARSLTQVFLLLGYLAFVNFRLFLVSVTLLVPVSYMIDYFGKMNKRVADIRQTSFGGLNGLLNEIISCIRVVKAFNMERYEARRFSNKNNILLNLFTKNIRIASLSTPLLELVGAVYILMIFIYGTILVNHREITSGEFVSFLLAFFMISSPIRSLNGFNLKMQEAAAAARRIFELLDHPDNTKQDLVKPQAPVLEREIEIAIKSFAYHRKVVLKDIDIRIKKGEVIAIVGHSGSGKTTLANLIPRFFDLAPEQGQIKFDGQDIRKFSTASLRENIALVSQDTVLFNDTVRYNIAYGKIDQPLTKIIAASKQAFAHDFIQSFDQGYDQLIGDKGLSISGGQRQRISIARAILKDAPILILDEATNSLDAQSEISVSKALEHLMLGRTTIVIAHKLSTIQRADKIFVMQDGSIIERGKFAELLQKGGHFRTLYEANYSDLSDRVLT